jgi:hypothetical protein
MLILETNVMFRRVPTFWTKHLTNKKDMNGRQAWLDPGFEMH